MRQNNSMIPNVLTFTDDLLQNNEADNALIYATKNGYVEIIELLLNDGRFNPCIDNNFAIAHAARNGRFDIVKLFLFDGRSNPSAQKNIVLLEAIKQNNVEIVKILLNDNRVNPWLLDDLLIIEGIKNNNVEIIKLLLDDNIFNVDLDINLNNAIMLATKANKFDIANILLDKKQQQQQFTSWTDNLIIFNHEHAKHNAAYDKIVAKYCKISQ